MSKNILIGVVTVVVVVGGGFVLMQNKVEAPQPIEKEVKKEGEMMMEDGSMMQEGMMSNGIKEFTVVGTPFKFSLNEIRVKKGETVRIIFKNDGGKHDWKVDEFKAATKVLDAGQQDTIEFIADKTGTFEYYCSVGQHRQMGMKGNLIVE